MVLIGRTPLVLLSALLILACGNAASDNVGAAPPTEGEMVFNANCAMCHGRKGDLGMSGAKNLTVSALSRDELIAVVTNGKGAMMPYGKTLSRDQIEAVVDHVMTLRSPAPAK